jgi:hypothetical protein
MSTIKISIINESTIVSDDEVIAAIADLQTQVSGDFAAAWGIDADLTFVPSGSQPPSGSWWLSILDNSDQAGALGYHDVTNEGLPLGKVFAATDKQFGTQWTVTASHELLEMLGDPDINLTALVQSNDTTGRLYAYEVADACEADNYGYTIGNTLVSDFVFPAWFESFAAADAKLDQQGQIQKPFEILPGGYISVFDITSSNGWQQVTGQQARANYSSRAYVGSRRERRRTPRHAWLKSENPFSRSTSRRKAADAAGPIGFAGIDGHGSANPNSKPPIKAFIPSPNHSSRNGAKIKMIVLHCTEANAQNTLAEFKNPNGRQVSAHYVIDVNGDIYQMVEDSERANHARGANQNSIGIEHVRGADQPIADAQAAASARLISWLLAEYEIPRSEIYGHDFAPGYDRSGGGTTCPDKLFGDRHTQQAVANWVAHNIV